MSVVHIPVLKNEVLALLKPQANQDYIDATVGLGGHAKAILQKTLPGGRLLGIDRDPRNLKIAKKNLASFGDRVELVCDSYANIKPHAYDHSFNAVDGVLLDLGFSSAHIEDPSRGFSFNAQGPLDMRYDPSQELTAEQVVNSWPEDNLAKIFRLYGEEGHARQIAKAIYKNRKKERFTSTIQLAEFIQSIIKRRGRIHPATKVFQALRIAVNDEIGELERGLPALMELIKPGGHIAVISFHSVEDRVVKRSFAAQDKTKTQVKTKKPIQATKEEIQNNPRSRSAKLRVAQKMG